MICLRIYLQLRPGNTEWTDKYVSWNFTGSSSNAHILITYFQLLEHLIIIWTLLWNKHKHSHFITCCACSSMRCSCAACFPATSCTSGWKVVQPKYVNALGACSSKRQSWLDSLHLLFTRGLWQPQDTDKYTGNLNGINQQRNFCIHTSLLWFLRKTQAMKMIGWVTYKIFSYIWFVFPVFHISAEKETVKMSQIEMIVLEHNGDKKGKTTICSSLSQTV